MNDHCLMIVGKSTTGKSASLAHFNKPEGVMYLNCEAGKRLPFRQAFGCHLVISDPLQIFEAFQEAENMPEIHTIVIDSLTYLLDMYESMYVLESTNTMQAWGDFAQYFKKVMQQHVATSTKTVIFTAHTKDTINESEMVLETKVPVKGSLKNNGIESYFTVVIATKRVKLKALEGYESPYLTITDEEKDLGFKYVYQTRPTKETVNESLRGPVGMFSVKETFIDNNAQFVIDRLNEYYK